jgi:RecJ-like exonuclease
MKSMALRSQFDWVVRCPKCGAIGHIWASEDEHVVRRNAHFAIDEISSGFSLLKMGSSALDTDIVCEKCNVVV